MSTLSRVRTPSRVRGGTTGRGAAGGTHVPVSLSRSVSDSAGGSDAVARLRTASRAVADSAPASAAVSAVAQSAYVAAVLADNPLAYYRMGESSGAVMVDSSGNGHNGTYANVTLGATRLQTSDADKAVLFDGSTSRVSVPHGAWQNPTFLTVEAIVQYTGSGERMIASRDIGGSDRQFQFYIANSSLLLSCNVWRQDHTFASAQCSPGGGPSEHVALTYDGTNIKLYLNGVLGATTPFSGSSLAAVTAALEIGSLIGTEVWTNTIDEVAIYGTALSAARLLAHAHAAGY